MLQEHGIKNWKTLRQKFTCILESWGNEKYMPVLHIKITLTIYQIQKQHVLPPYFLGVKTVVDGAMRKPICVHKVVQTSKKSRENEDKGTHYVLSGKYKDEAKANWRKIGALLWLQPDPDQGPNKFSISISD